MRNMVIALLSVFLTLVYSTAIAAPAIFSDEFTGDEPTTLNLNPEGDNIQLQYKVLGPFTVDQTGAYKVSDARQTFFLDITMHIYINAFDPALPGLGFVASVDDGGEVELQTGTEYVLVVQPFFAEAVGAWGAVLDGPGTPSAPAKVLPTEFSGTFSADDVLANVIPEFVGCPESYINSFTYVPTTSGLHYFGAQSVFDDPPTPIAISIHDAEFDPNNPYDNQINVGPSGVQAVLRAGETYWIVVQPDCDIFTQDWSIVITPSNGAFLWGNYMKGVWLDPTTLGQGIVLDVFTDNNLIFAAWFTWDTATAAEGTPSDIGDPSMRWMTMAGTYVEGTESVLELTLYSASGGVFNSPDSPVSEPAIGTVTLDMHDGCLGGTMSWQMDNGTQGSAALQRAVPTGFENCFFEAAQPGVYE